MAKPRYICVVVLGLLWQNASLYGRLLAPLTYRGEEKPKGLSLEILNLTSLYIIVMRAKILLVLCLFLGYSALRAQSIQGSGELQSSKSDTIAFEVFDRAIYRVFYKMQYVPDTTLVERKREGQTLLLVGKRYQGFLDYNAHQKDSIFNVRTKEGSGVAAMGEAIALGRREVFGPYLIKDYPEKGSTLFQDNVMSRSRHRYIDKHGDIAWELYDESREIHGYKALKATCSYRGRSYTAWYSPDIPISSGPYVFGGLPGLILQIEDSRGHYSFTLSGFHKVDTYDPIYVEAKSVVETSREKVRQMKQNLADNPELVLKGLNGGANIKMNGLPKPKPRPYNPIELE